ncbi:MAG: hypothetical protein RLZZ330_735 [Actinomycetota bacterium]|jgi:nicotinate-nucleotide adenylyltransferase
MRIGILGGSFDPPHLGHIAMAEAATEFLKLDEVVFVPAALQWQKSHHAPADVRAHMTHLAISNHPRWKVSFVDLDRGGETYSYQTLQDLKTVYPEDELFFILGSDSANSLSTWKEADKLASTAKFAVVKRFGIDVEVPQGFDYQQIPGEIPNISSTQIRDVVAKSNEVEKDLKVFVPLEVAKYINSVGLYR